MSYLALKHIHLTCVALSGAGFLLRGFWMLRDSSILQARWVRVLPHIIDTGLLVSAIALAVMSLQYPIAQGWLTAKVIGLLAYIGFGTMALKRGKTKAQRTLYLVLALLTFAYIVGVALTRNASLRLI